MKFDDLIFLVQTGAAIAAAAAGNPMLAASADAGNRLIKIARDAFVSGRERAEWTPEQEELFWHKILPEVTSRPHWQE
jgi:hypothetical protein